VQKNIRDEARWRLFV